jgi:hypothetical protein
MIGSPAPGSPPLRLSRAAPRQAARRSDEAIAGQLRALGAGVVRAARQVQAEGTCDYAGDSSSPATTMPSSPRPAVQRHSGQSRHHAPGTSASFPLGCGLASTAAAVLASSKAKVRASGAVRSPAAASCTIRARARAQNGPLLRLPASTSRRSEAVPARSSPSCSLFVYQSRPSASPCRQACVSRRRVLPVAELFMSLCALFPSETSGGLLIAREPCPRVCVQ